VKDITLSAVIIVALAAFMVFFVWAMASAGKKALRHNEQQVLECKELGGFARTDVDGWLIDCTFPRSR
jgi:hypothetical protein